MDELVRTLSEIEKAGWQSNPVTNAMLTDYAKYHTLLIIVCGIAAAVLLGLGIFCLIRFLKAPKKETWGFAKKVYFSFGIVSVSAIALMMLMVALNTANAFSPEQGFSSMVNGLTEQRDASMEETGSDINAWIMSGNQETPAALQTIMDERTQIYSEKVVKGSIWLSLFVLGSVVIWFFLIRRLDRAEREWQFNEVMVFFLGLLMVPLSTLMVVMILINMQGAFTPLASLLEGLTW